MPAPPAPSLLSGSARAQRAAPPPHHRAPALRPHRPLRPRAGIAELRARRAARSAPPARGLTPSTPGAVVPSPRAEGGGPGQQDYGSREVTRERVGQAGGGAGTAPVLISTRVCRQSRAGGGGRWRAAASGSGRAAGPRPAMRHEAPMQVGLRAGEQRGVRRARCSREPGRGRSPSARAAGPALLLRAEGEGHSWSVGGPGHVRRVVSPAGRARRGAAGGFHSGTLGHLERCFSDTAPERRPQLSWDCLAVRCCVVSCTVVPPRCTGSWHDASTCVVMEQLSTYTGERWLMARAGGSKEVPLLSFYVWKDHFKGG